MPRYEVAVSGTRVICINTVITVKAESKEEAEDKALQEALNGNADFVEESSSKGRDDDWDAAEVIDELV